MAEFETGLRVLWDRGSSGDPRHYTDGRWEHDGPECVRCSIGPGVAAAALWLATDNEDWRALAIETMDAAIRDHARPDGSIGSASAAGQPVDIQTSLFALNLGLATHLLLEGDGLDATRRDAYTSTIAAAADFLAENGNYEWYTNGNIVLANCAVAGIAWRLTGNERYWRLYDDAYAFAIAPPQARWPGRGLRYSVDATLADGSDGAAYLTEEGDGGVGFDPDYTQMQADIASIMTLVVDDDRSRRLTNLLLNQILERVDEQTWLLDTDGGSRHTETGREVPFTTGSLAVMAAEGRTDLQPLVPTQRSNAAQFMRSSTEYTDVGVYMAWASRAAPIIATLAETTISAPQGLEGIRSRGEHYPV